MSGQVIYACNCLNVKVYLANKYRLEEHLKYRKTKFIKEPSISGWDFELSEKGITVEYPSLVSETHSVDWITIRCHNCDSGDTYSVNKSIDSSNQVNRRIIIHDGTIFGQDIIDLLDKDSYSHAFGIVLNHDLPLNHVFFEKPDDTLESELQYQQKQVEQMLEQILTDLEVTTKKKIQAYQKEQESKLTKEKEKASHDSVILWHTIKERFRNNKNQQETLDLNKNRLEETIEKQANTNEIQMNEHDGLFDKSYIPQRRSSALTRDLFGKSMPTLHNRRSSHVSDVDSIASDFEKTASELPPSRRRSSLIPQNLQLPAAPSTYKTTSNTILPSPSFEDKYESNIFILDDVHTMTKKQSQEHVDLFNDGVAVKNQTSATNHSPALISVKDKISENRPVHPSSSLIEPTYFKKDEARRPSFVGFDYAQADREVSSQLPPLDMARGKIGVTVTSNHVTSNSDTQDMNINDKERMIPPHMLAAHTVTDETEAIFGSVPHSSIRNRPMY